MKNRPLILALAVFLLLAQLALRTHDLLSWPLFVDELGHTQRAVAVSNLDNHPALNSHGKMLFYFIPAVLFPEDNVVGVFLARLSVAMTSLVTSAVIFALARRMMNRWAGVAAMAFYAFVPYVIFFERMAFADPPAGLMAALTVWAALRFTDKPTNGRAIQLGTAMAATLAAKLTMSLVCTIPAFTILLTTENRSVRGLWDDYGWPTVKVLLTVAGWWMLVLIPATIDYYRGIDWALIDTHFVNPDSETLSSGSKWEAWWDKMGFYVSIPMTLVLFLALILYARLRLRLTIIIMLWLALAWFPMFVLFVDKDFQTRYLMTAFPAVALIFGGGIYALQQMPNAALQRWSAVGVVGGLAIWVLFFTLPFMNTAIATPAELELNELDERNYQRRMFNTFGIDEAMDYLNRSGERHEGQVHVITQTFYCLPGHYSHLGIAVNCQRREILPPDFWDQTIVEPLQAGIPIYILTDFVGYEPAYEGVVAERLGTYPRPNNGIVVELWGLELASVSAE